MPSVAALYEGSAAAPIAEGLLANNAAFQEFVQHRFDLVGSDGGLVPGANRHADRCSQVGWFENPRSRLLMEKPTEPRFSCRWHALDRGRAGAS